MEMADPLGLIVVCAIIGVATYCLACAFHVWRRRNRGVLTGDAARNPRAHARSVAYVLGGLGLLAMAGGVLGHALLRWEGVLSGEQLFVVMKPRADLLLQHLAAAQEIRQGAIVARFRPPEREAVSPRRATRNASLATGAPVSTQRFLADSQINRELAELATRQLELEMAAKDVQLEAARLKRTTLEERLKKKDELRKLDLDLQEARNELDQATIRLAFERQKAQRSEVLHHDQLISTEAFQAAMHELQIGQSEVEKLAERVTRLDARRASVEGDLKALETASRSHGATLQRLLDGLGAQLAAVQARRRSLSAFTDTTNVVAPFSGRVVYRDPSPAMAPADAPIMVIAPPDGVRVKIRMPESRMAHLERAGTVHFRLAPTYLVHREKRHFLERRFTGRLLRWKALPDDPGIVVAEFACDPPEEAVREMVSGREVVAELRWIPPLVSIPSFTTGAGMVALAGLGLVLLRVVEHRRASPGLSPPPLPRAGDSHDGAAGDGGVATEDITLRALGADLRELIRRKRLDGSTLPAAEWALGRYQVRAGRLLSAGLRFDAAAAAELQEWARELLGSAARPEDDADREQVRAFRRLIRLLVDVAPASHAAALRRLDAAMAGRAPDDWVAQAADTRAQPRP